MSSYALREAGVSLFLTIGILPLLFMLFPDSIFIASNYHFFPLFICYHCVRYLYVILQWYWFIMVDFITCSGYLRLSAYTWSIFLTYMRRRLSSHLRFSVFWEVGRKKTPISIVMLQIFNLANWLHHYGSLSNTLSKRNNTTCDDQWTCLQLSN